LAVAGVAKLADRTGARQAVTDFGVPKRLAAAVAGLLAGAELAAAVLLIASSSARVGAAVALALMATFCAAITRSLLRGEAPDCHCFGTIHSEPAGPRTLIRNLALAAAAGVVLAGGPGVSATDWVGGIQAGGLTVGLGAALAAASVGGGLLVLNLLKRNGELLLRVDELEDALTASGLIVPEAQSPVATEGLPVGTTAPHFELPGLDGKTVSPDTLQDGGDDLLLVFSDPACGPCSALMPLVAQWQRERPAGLRTVLISRGAPEANLVHAREHGLNDILLQTDREVSESFAVSATPSAVVVASDGTVASAVHAGEDQIRALVTARESGDGGDGGDTGILLPVHHSASGDWESPVGQVAPDPALRTLEGKIVALSQKLPDGEALLVFWNPDCGFCERMLESLRELDAGEPGLVLISTGSPAANRELGLRAPILLDDGFAAGNAFGAMGTPSAVRVDSERRVASAVAVGAEALLALALAGASPIAA
jgi:peroxiredoxin